MKKNLTDRYPVEELPIDEDDGTMPDSVQALRNQVVGQKIVNVEKAYAEYEHPDWSFTDRGHGLVLTLDNGKKVFVADTNDCCAYTQVDNFLLNAEHVDHVITGVGTTEEYTRWHIYADYGDMLQLDVGWSCGNPFYYGYGFDIAVIEDYEVTE